MFGWRQSQSRRRAGQAQAPIKVYIGDEEFEVDAVADVSRDHPWRGKPLRELRWQGQADLLHRIAVENLEVEVDEENYRYAGESGYDGRAYSVVVERTGKAKKRRPLICEQKVAEIPVEQRAVAEAQREPAGPPQPSPAPESTQEPAISVEEPQPLEPALPGSAPEELQPLVAQGPSPSQAEGDLGARLAKLLQGTGEDEVAPPAPAPRDYASLTKEEYEAMSTEEASKVPPEVVERLYKEEA